MKSKRRGSVALLAVASVYVLLESRCTFADEGEALPTVEEISRVTAERNSQLHSLYVKVRMRGELLGKVEDAKQYLGLITLIDEVKTFAFSGDMRFAEVSRDVDHYVDMAPSIPTGDTGGKEEKEGEIPKPTKEFNELLEKISSGLRKQGTDPQRVKGLESGVIPVERGVINRYDGKLLSTWYDIDKPRIHLMGQEYAAAKKHDGGHFSQTYMWLVFHKIRDCFNKNVDRGEHRLPEAFTRFNTRIRPDREEVDGAQCIVIELGDESTLWCDPSLGYAVRQWEKLSPEARDMSDRCESTDFTEVAPNMWLPRMVVWKRWAPPDAPDDLKREPLMQYVFESLELHANDVPDSLFKTDMAAVPPGTLVVDNINTVSKDGFDLATNYKLPAEAEHLDEAVAQAKEEMKQMWEERDNHDSRKDKMGPPKKASLGYYWLAAINIVIIAILLGLIVLRKNRTNQ